MIPATETAQGDETVRLQQAITDRLAAVPGVSSAAFAAFNDGLPLDGDGRGRTPTLPASAEHPSSLPLRTQRLPHLVRVRPLDLLAGQR